jgi:hypothetical protein
VSYKLVDAALSFYLPAREKAVLVVLCKHAHDDGTQSRASIYTLTMESGFKRTAVKTALRWLEENSFIVAESGKQGGRNSQTVVYRILFPNADMLEAMGTRSQRNPVATRPGCDTTAPGRDTTIPGRHTTGTRSPHDHESVLESVCESVSESVQPGADGGTVPLSVISTEDRARLKPTMKQIREVWEGFFLKYLPERYPATHINQVKVWSQDAKNFQAFADKDYRELKVMLTNETEAQMLKRWAVFIRTKYENENGWDGAEYPFRIFARQP